jgi:hypothetical protein
VIINSNFVHYKKKKALGESGIVSSKLSNFLGTSTSGSSSDSGNSNFLPNSYLSRFDLVNWKALVEHPFATELDQKVHISFVLMIFCNVSIILLGFILL